MTKKKTRAKKKTASASTKTVIVKRKAHAEHFDERKVYASAYFACRNAHLSEIQSEKIAEKVSAKVSAQLKSRKIILSDLIYSLIIQELKKFNADAAFLYETHRDIN